MVKIEAYRAEDGTVFASKIACLEYENAPIPKMFGPDGAEVKDDENAYVVFIPNEQAANVYKDICVLPKQFRHKDVEEGLYVWDIGTEEMRYIPMNIAKYILRAQRYGMDILGKMEEMEADLDC